MAKESSLPYYFLITGEEEGISANLNEDRFVLKVSLLWKINQYMVFDCESNKNRCLPILRVLELKEVNL